MIPRSANVVIVGGGMVGASLAAAFACNPYLGHKKVCLLEAAPAPKSKANPTSATKDEFSNRVSALNSASRKLLEGIGAWKGITDTGRYHGFNRMLVWDELSAPSIEFKGDPDLNDGYIGHLVENDTTVNALTNSLSKLSNNFDPESNLQVIYGARISSCQIPSNKNEPTLPSIVLQSGDKIEATDLLVGADGANSIVRRSMQTVDHYFNKDYQQMGIVGTIKFDKDFDNKTAYQKFTKTGPIAILPLSDSVSSLVWTVPREWAKDFVKMDPVEFGRKLNNALLERPQHSSVVQGLNMGIGALLRYFSSRSPITAPIKGPPVSIERVDNLAAFPLGTGLPNRCIGPKTALIGDAAHRMHPLAGQGVNLGFGDVACMIQVLEESVKRGEPFLGYDENALSEYETQRLRHNLPTMAAVDGLQQLYCTDNILAILARSAGLQIIDSNNTLKGLAMAQAGR
jgi:ubiquinone biosynthesis monooxygenase Coq6